MRTSPSEVPTHTLASRSLTIASARARLASGVVAARVTLRPSHRKMPSSVPIQSPLRTSGMQAIDLSQRDTGDRGGPTSLHADEPGIAGPEPDVAVRRLRDRRDERPGKRLPREHGVDVPGPPGDAGRGAYRR